VVVHVRLLLAFCDIRLLGGRYALRNFAEPVSCKYIIKIKIGLFIRNNFGSYYMLSLPSWTIRCISNSYPFFFFFFFFKAPIYLQNVLVH
jgi:hypothetical protein